jgi:hypothetical protein
MGGNHGKQHGEKGRRTSIRKVLRFSLRRSIIPSRPVSYAEIDDQPNRERQIPTRPLSMYDVVPFHHSEISKTN